MVQINDELLARLEKLSMLKIDPTKRADIKADLNRFLEFVEVLDDLDLSKVELSYIHKDQSAPLRKDLPSLDPTISQEILKNAPKTIDNFFVVPKIIE